MLILFGFSKQVRRVEGQKEEKVGLMAEKGQNREQQTKQKRIKECQKRTVGAAGMETTRQWRAREARNLGSRQAEAGHARRHLRDQARGMRKRQTSEATGGGGSFAH